MAFEQQQQQQSHSVSLNQRLRRDGLAQVSSNRGMMFEQEPALTESQTNNYQQQYTNQGVPLSQSQYQQENEFGQAEQLQDDFTLLDVIGGAGLSVLHPTKPIVAYTSGCIIIVFDLMSDTKIQLTSHEHEVHALAFSPAGAGGLPGQGGDYLISIDFNRNEPNEENGPLSRLFIWDWRQGQCLQQVRVPTSQSPSLLYNPQMPNLNDLRAGKPLRFYQIVFDKSGSTFMVLESSTSETAGWYRASVWNFNRAQQIGLVSHDDLDLQQTCLGISLLSSQTNPTTLSNPIFNKATGNITVARGDGNSQLAQIYLTNSISFLSVEKSCIKIWEMSQGAFELKKRIHIKQEIKHCLVSDLTGFLLILGMNGKVLILDSKGEFVSTVSRQGVFFTCIGTCDDRLLLGTEKGTVHAYHIASLQFINEIPYQIGLLPNMCINDDLLRITNQVGANRPLNKMEEALLKVGPPVSGIQSTKDKRFVMITYQDSSFAVIDRQVVTSLSDSILGYQYGHFESITGLQWLGMNQTKMGGPLVSDQYQIIHQANECFATCSADLSVYVWRHFGDRWNMQYIDITKCFDKSLSYQRKFCDKSTASLKLTALQVLPKRSTLVVADNRGTVRIFELGSDEAQLVSTHHLQRSPEMLGDSSTAVKSMYFTQDEQVAIVTYDTGLVSAYDVRGGFTWLGDIEKGVPRLNVEMVAKVLERNEIQDPTGMHLINQFRPVNSQETKFSVFSIRGPNCIKQQLVEVKDNRLGMTPLTQFFIDSGKITGFDIHPSKDYILITSSKGKIYVFRIDTGELRGTIDVPLHAQDCVIDPSGLYVCVKVPPFSPRHTSNLTNAQEEFANMGLNERDLSHTTILMYEVGTKKVAAEVHSIFDISTMQFSGDGRYLALGSHKGSVSIWALGDHLFRAVHEVIERMKAHQDFWCNYPIYLKDHQAQSHRSQSQQQPYYGTETKSAMFTPQAAPYSDNQLSQQQQNYQHQSEVVDQLQQQPFAPQFSEEKPFTPSQQHMQHQQQQPDYQQQQFEQMVPRNELQQNYQPNIQVVDGSNNYDDNLDQTPLRQKAMSQDMIQQPSIENNTNLANYSEPMNQEQIRMQEVDTNSQDMVPSNYAAHNKSGSVNLLQHQQQSSQQAASQQMMEQQQQHQQNDSVQFLAPQNSKADAGGFVDQQSNAQRFLRGGESQAEVDNNDNNNHQSQQSVKFVAESNQDQRSQRQQSSQQQVDQLPTFQPEHSAQKPETTNHKDSTMNKYNAPSQPQAENALESLYRQQQPRQHPLRDDHEYNRYLQKQANLRQSQGLPPHQHQQMLSRQQQHQMMPSANELNFAQTQQPGDNFGYDQSMLRGPSAAQNNVYSQSYDQRRAMQNSFNGALMPNQHDIRDQRSPQFFGTGAQREPVDIDAGIIPVGGRSQFMNQNNAPQAPMLYTDSGVIIPQANNALHQPQPHAYNSSQPQQAYYQDVHQAPRDPMSFGAGSAGSARPPQQYCEMGMSGRMSQHQQQYGSMRDSHQMQQQQILRGSYQRSDSRDLAQAYNERDEFEARMQKQRMMDSQGLYQKNTASQATTGYAVPLDPPEESTARVYPPNDYQRNYVAPLDPAPLDPPSDRKFQSSIAPSIAPYQSSMRPQQYAQSLIGQTYADNKAV